MTLKHKIAKLVKRIAAHNWYIPLSSFIVALDFFIAPLPSTTFVIASCILKPKKWLLIVFTYTFATIVGAICFLYLFATFSDNVLDFFFPSLDIENRTQGIIGFLNTYGVIGLFLLACTPIPIRTISMIAILLGCAFWPIIFAISTGRLLLYLLLGYLSSKSPQWILARKSVSNSSFIREVLNQHQDSSPSP